MRFYTQQHQFYCGIDLQARPRSLCIFNRDGEMLVHRNMKTRPDTFLTAIAPSREDLVVCVECLFTWSWLADLCARAGIPFVLGPALYMKAIHGGKANHDQRDAQKIAVWRRGGMLPQAYGSPAALRATRDRLRRRMPLLRTRAELLAHLPNTHRQDPLPAIGKKIASQANRDGIAERLPEPAVPKSLAVALALIGSYAPLLTALALPSVQTAKPHDAQTRSRLQAVPGIGQIRSVVWLDAMHDIQRFPRGQDFVSSCRLVQCAKESAGQRYGTAGAKIANASLQWACAAAAVLLLRNHPAGQQYRARLEKKHGTGQA